MAISSADEVPSNGAQFAAYSRQSGRTYISGTFDSDVFPFGGHQLTSMSTHPMNANAYLMQVAPNGQVEWLKRMCQTMSFAYGSRLLAIEEGVIATFRFVDTAFVSGTHIAAVGEHSLLIRYDVEGNVNWVHHFDSEQGVTQLMGMAMDEEGDLYVSGIFTSDLHVAGHSIQVDGNVQELDAELFIAKLTPNGNLEWLKYLGGGSGFDFITAMTYLNGKLFLTGRYNGLLQMGDMTIISSSSNNGFVACTDSSGESIWLSRLSGDYVSPSAIATVGGKVVVSGGFNGILELDLLNLQSDGPDGFVISMNALGGVNWGRTIGGPSSEAIVGIDEVNDNLMMLSGFSTSTSFEIDGFEFVNAATEQGFYNSNMFVLAVGESDDVQCLYTLGSSRESRGFALHVSADTVVMAGGYGVELPIGDTVIFADGASTFYAKTCMGCSELIRLDVAATTTARHALHLHPNPAAHTVRVEVSGSGFQIQSVVLTDMLGHKVLSIPFGEVGGAELDVSGLPAGVYPVAATLQNGEMLRQRLVVQ